MPDSPIGCEQVAAPTAGAGVSPEYGRSDTYRLTVIMEFLELLEAAMPGTGACVLTFDVASTSGNLFMLNGDDPIRRRRVVLELNGLRGDCQTYAEATLSMANHADGSEQSAPWTIKGMPVATRRRATECAGRADETVAEWMVRAVNRQADMEAGNLIMPQGKPSGFTGGIRPESSPLDLGGLGLALQAIVGAYQAAGRDVPVSLGREAKATLVQHLRAVRGLPERQTRSGNGQTRLIEGDGATAEAVAQ